MLVNTHFFSKVIFESFIKKMAKENNSLTCIISTFKGKKAVTILTHHFNQNLLSEVTFTSVGIGLSSFILEYPLVV